MATCFERIKKIAKGNYTDEEIRSILKDTEKELAERENLAEISGVSLKESIEKGADKLSDSVEKEQFRLSMEELNVARSASLAEPFMKLNIDPLKRFGRALTIGDKGAVKGSRARTLTTHLTKRRMNGRVQFANAVESVKDGMTVLKSSQYEESILKAINGKETNNEVSNKVGKAISKFREDSLGELEKHGVFIPRLENRGIYQSHDAGLMLRIGDTATERTRILSQNLLKADRANIYKDIAFNRWKDFMMPLLDLKRTFGEITSQKEGEMNDIFREIYDNITSDATGPGSATIQNQVSSERFFHFKDEGAQLEYNRKFGRGSLFDSLMQEADSTWNKVGILEVAGNNPLRYIDKTIRLAARQADKKFTKASINKAVDEAQYAMQQTLGLSTTVHGASGKLTNAIRLALFAKIAPALLPLVAVADVAPAINMMSELGGKGIFRSAIKVFSVAKNVVRNEQELQNYVQAMGFRRDIQIGSIEKWAGVKDKELRSRLMRVMMKLSPHEFMNYVEGLSTSHEMTLMLGQHAEKSFEKLPPKLSKVLNLYGVDKDRWNLMRKGKMKVGEYTHITSDAIRNLDKDNIKSFLKKKFNLEKVSDVRVEQERAQTQQLFTQMIQDRMATGSNLIDVRQRNFWAFNFDLRTEKGRKMANLFSIFGSLRYYETAIVQRTLAPLIYGETGESAFRQILTGKFDRIGLARWSAISFATGALAFTLQDLMKGREPDEGEILTRAMLAPLGALGQALEVGKGFGHDASRTALGPGFNLLFDSITDLARVMRFDHPVKNSVNFVTTAVPGFNNTLARKGVHHLMQDQFGHMHRG